MTYYLYILCSQSTGRFYIGHTNNLARRLTQHQRNQSLSTRCRGPWELVYTEPHPTRAAAMRRERALKRVKSAATLRKLINSPMPG
ncbi:MAG: GIY-YIG nuclease family protein [bacterium]|nr:GIY-YIG nuclease family protein [bacterium]